MTSASGGSGGAVACAFGARGARVGLLIVQVGSALAYRGIPLQSAYCASKHAIRGFHDALRCELLHRGSKVRATHVLMPAVNTPPVQLGALSVARACTACAVDLPAGGPPEAPLGSI